MQPVVLEGMSDPLGDDPLPELANGRVRLREVQVGDAAALTELFARREVSEHLSPPPGTVEAFTEWIEMCLERRREGRAACYAVLDSNGRVSGLFMCLRMAPDANEAEIGFALAPHLWGTGVFQSAAEVYIDTLFARWPIARLIGRTLARNHRGLGAMRKLGATIVEHTQREDETEFVWAIKRDVWQRASKPSGPQAPKPSGA